MQSTSDKILVGKVSGVHGVKGWVKIFSYTRPAENILNYSPWYLARDVDEICKPLLESQIQGKKIIVRLEELTDPDEAQGWVNADILVEKSCLPELPYGEYFWHDIIGLKVLNSDDTELGVVEEMLETGANDVVVISGKERVLIPWVMDEYITEIDLEAGLMHVDWQGEQ